MRRDFSAVALPEIYVVRVVETAWESEGRQLGYLDSPISAKGIRQAQTAGSVLKDLVGKRSVRIETSPLGRAGHTAALLCAAMGLGPEAISVSVLLVDHNLGSWQGLTNAEIDARFPGARLKREKDKWNYAVPGGESYAHIHARVHQWLAARRVAEVTVAVTHRMVSRVLQGAYAGMTREETLLRSHPPGRIYRLHDGRVDEVACDAGAAPRE